MLGPMGEIILETIMLRPRLLGATPLKTISMGARLLETKMLLGPTLLRTTILDINIRTTETSGGKNIVAKIENKKNLNGIIKINVPNISIKKNMFVTSILTTILSGAI